MSPDQMCAPEPRTATVHLDGAEISTATWGPPGPPQIVFLHDGLGSISQWRSVPEEVAQKTGAVVMAYDRPGHGASRPVPSAAWPVDWLRHEADRLDQLLEQVGALRPLVVGHSDGGSIALLHAARHTNVGAALTVAAHAWLEEEAVAAITALRANDARVLAGLARHHDDPQAVFNAWSGVWLSDGFRSWDIRPELGAISVPCRVVQGDRDEYGTSLQATDTAAVIGANAVCTMVPGGRHLLHHDDPELVVNMVVDFWHELTDTETRRSDPT